MKIGELITHLEDWAPPGAAWEKDNAGLQVGSGDRQIINIMLCLELDQGVLKEALRKKCNFILTHHPLIFTPLKRLDFETDKQSRLINQIIKNDLTVYSAHTNLDFTKEGVSFELARILDLKNIRFLQPQENNQYKLTVFVPEADTESVADAVFKAGGGIIGEYNECSFRSPGEGTFTGTEKSNPAVGKKNNSEKVNEDRLEFLIYSWKLRSVVSALIKAHPYEEPAYDIYPLKNKNTNFGAGTVGEFDYPLTPQKFLTHTAGKLKLKTFKYCTGESKLIKRVAVCGGSGSDLLQTAVAVKADAFITADIKYHSFHDAAGKIMLVDAGHYETEIHVLDSAQRKIGKLISDDKNIKIFKYSGSTNPVRFFKQ
jgi:dinuclear metal center YbgI/SA1388 family protein